MINTAICSILAAILLTGCHDGNAKPTMQAKAGFGGTTEAVTNHVVSFEKVPPTNSLYMVINVSGGPDATNYPVTFLSEQPPLTDEYRTRKILLRRIPAGNFIMGSRKGEIGRLKIATSRGEIFDDDEHPVVLTEDFYIGVLEMTKAQVSNVMDKTYPKYFIYGDLRMPFGPSWDDVRGHAIERVNAKIRTVVGLMTGLIMANPYVTSPPETNSFIGRLREKTGYAFDLPTEAQWEYACRAGTTNALNNDTNLVNLEKDPNMDILGRYAHNGGVTGPNQSTGYALGGSYLSNKWGLFDMHGNVAEWCLDFYSERYYHDPNAITNPAGPAKGYGRVKRGGLACNGAKFCRSASRSENVSDAPEGFRLCLTVH